MSEENDCLIVAWDKKAIKIACELGSNDTSYNMIQLLLNRDLYKNQIAKALDVDFKLVVYHLKKLELLKMVTISEKELVKKGAIHKIYRVNSNKIILHYGMIDDVLNDIKQKDTRESITIDVKNTLRDNIKFSVIALPSIIAFLIVDLPFFLPYGTQQSTNIPLFAIPLSVLGISIVVTKISLYLKNRFYK